MVTIHLTGKLTEDRKLIVDIPDDIPPGDVLLTLEITGASPKANEATERARAKLMDAGRLSMIWKAPPNTVPPTENELLELGTLPPGSPSVKELIDADREEH